jgi:hypothetical protein
MPVTLSLSGIVGLDAGPRHDHVGRLGGDRSRIAQMRDDSACGARA